MRLRRQSGTHADVVEFTPTLLANLLPLVGISWFGWHTDSVLVTYWLELVSTLVAYGGAALFAERPTTVEGRTIVLPGFSSSAVSSGQARTDRPDRIRLTDSLPPIYRRNVRPIAWSTTWGLGLAVLVPAIVYPPLVETPVSLPLVGTALAMIAARLAEVRREFFEKSAYEEWSPHMVLELPCRVVCFTFVLVLLVQGVGALLLLALATAFGPSAFGPTVLGVGLTEGSITVGYTVILILGKIFVEWSRFRANRESIPTGIAAWFAPENPRTE